MDNNKNEDLIKDKKEETHICNYHYISSSEGSYNICKECGNIILIYQKG